MDYSEKRIETKAASICVRCSQAANCYLYDLTVPYLLSKEQQETILRMIMHMKRERAFVEPVKLLWPELPE